MKKIITLSTLILVFTLSSCNATKNSTKKTTSEMVSGKYEIRSVEGASNLYNMFFEIDASEKQISGKTDCNSFSGNYVVTGDEVTFSPFVSTKMYCEEQVMKVENSIFKAFSNTKKFTYDDNMLTLINEDGTISLKAYKVITEDK
ncbi:MAG: META domain-containing protein [Flavobacteriaceae bacterium]|nr:META domain-containing protein [Flavobacteriaceae bacterium]